MAFSGIWVIANISGKKNLNFLISTLATCSGDTSTSSFAGSCRASLTRRQREWFIERGAKEFFWSGEVLCTRPSRKAQRDISPWSYLPSTCSRDSEGHVNKTKILDDSKRIWYKNNNNSTSSTQSEERFTRLWRMCKFLISILSRENMSQRSSVREFSAPGGKRLTYSKGKEFFVNLQVWCMIIPW